MSELMMRKPVHSEIKFRHLGVADSQIEDPYLPTPLAPLRGEGSGERGYQHV